MYGGTPTLFMYFVAVMEDVGEVYTKIRHTTSNLFVSKIKYRYLLSFLSSKSGVLPLATPLPDGITDEYIWIIFRDFFLFGI